MTNMMPIVRTVHTPTVRRESRAASAEPVLTSEDMSSILRVASNPGMGSGSSTSHTRLNMMKYITPRKPANIEAMMPTNARFRVSTELRRCPSPTL